MPIAKKQAGQDVKFALAGLPFHLKTQYMPSDKEMTSQESLDLIARMITTARNDYRETGVSALLWGSVVSFCSLITFGNHYWKIPNLEYCWFLTFAAIIPQVIITVNESKRKRVKGFHGDWMGGVWFSFGVVMFLLSWYMNLFEVPKESSLVMIIYGIPTFTAGFATKFRPMMFGGIACWVLAIISMYTPFPYIMLLQAAAAQLAWFIPGLILRSRYLKAKQGNV